MHGEPYAITPHLDDEATKLTRQMRETASFAINERAASKIATLSYQMSRMREALEFYADDQNIVVVMTMEPVRIDNNGVFDYEAKVTDKGDKAREVLR